MGFFVTIGTYNRVNHSTLRWPTFDSYGNKRWCWKRDCEAAGRDGVGLEIWIKINVLRFFGHLKSLYFRYDYQMSLKISWFRHGFIMNVWLSSLQIYFKPRLVLVEKIVKDVSVWNCMSLKVHVLSVWITNGQGRKLS